MAARPVEILEPRRLLSDAYVDPSAPGAQNGSSWQNAFTDLQQAIASGVTRIFLADGVYKPTTTTERTASFVLRNNLKIEGGYAGYGAPYPDLRDLNLYPSTLSGDIGTGVQTDNSYHVVVASNTNATAVLDGVRISGGYANGGTSNTDRGGGVFASAGNLTITNCTFLTNSAFNYGAGMYFSSSTPTISACTFNNNGNSQSGGYGGGIYLTNSPAVITGCTFSWNAMYMGGGAIHSNLSSPVITDCVFENNHSRYGGSAISFDGASTPSVSRCQFTGNTCELSATILNGFNCSASYSNCTFTGNQAWRGGGIEITNSNPNVTACTFIRNTADYSGGALSTNTTNAKIVGCRFYGNSVASNSMNGGGAIYSTQSTATLTNCEFVGNRAPMGGAVAGQMQAMTNCTFVANAAVTSGGAIYASGSLISLRNSIVRANTAPTGPQIHQTTGPPSVSYTNIQGGATGSGNIDLDALFERNPDPGADLSWGTSDDDYGDLRLRDVSPCVDAGLSGMVPAGISTDIAGNPRIANFPGVRDPGMIVDMGANEITIPADANGDGKVTTTDFNILAGSFGQSGKTFSQGNLDYDAAGLVDSVDFSLFTGHYGSQLPAPAPGPFAVILPSALDDELLWN